MTKKTTPEQDEIVAALEETGQQLKDIDVARAEQMRLVHSWVREGFKSELSGYKIAKSSGLSLPRVYQIRDQVKSEEADGSTPEAPTAE